MVDRKKRAKSALGISDLDSLGILKDVPRDSVFEMLALCPIKTLAPGEVLLNAGQVNRTMFMILSGSLNVYLESPEKDKIASLEAGQTVGEISVIDASPVTANVVAAQKTRLLAVDQETFWRLIAVSHEFAINLLVLLALRMRASNASILEHLKLMRRFEKDALIDKLTGLHNRRWLEDNLPRLTKRHQRDGRPMSLIILDVDRFKKFNDKYGHLAGDEVLVGVAKALDNDLRPTDLAARFGGEEFVVILSDTDLKGAVRAAERLRGVVKKITVETLEEVGRRGVTISLGVTQLRPDDDVLELLRRADGALYDAKRKGRDRVAYS